MEHVPLCSLDHGSALGVQDHLGLRTEHRVIRGVELIWSQQQAQPEESSRLRVAIENSISSARVVVADIKVGHASAMAADYPVCSRRSLIEAKAKSFRSGGTYPIVHRSVRHREAHALEA